MFFFSCFLGSNVVDESMVEVNDNTDFNDTFFTTRGMSVLLVKAVLEDTKEKPGLFSMSFCLASLLAFLSEKLITRSGLGQFCARWPLC